MEYIWHEVKCCGTSISSKISGQNMHRFEHTKAEHYVLLIPWFAVDEKLARTESIAMETFCLCYDFLFAEENRRRLNHEPVLVSV